MKLLTSVSFESILSYVHLPRCTWRDGPSDDEYSESPSVSQSEGRYELVFDTLRKLNVKKIVRVIAQDGKIPHRDEDIERMLAGFDVEEWEWEKIDICSEVVFEAAPNVRELSLYSSGNNAVLRSWSAKDGLARLQEVRV